MSEIDKVAWILIEDGLVLSTRSRGKDVWYLPGGKREPGETDLDTLRREVEEELSVAVDVRGAAHLGTFTAPAHGHTAGTTVRMTCYQAGYSGRLRPANEIAETAWFAYADRHRTSAVDHLVFDHLRAAGLLR
ncbi:NUDIX domain-containing protein [Micromonospora sp. RHAY321]|uniref:NUDIX hydrolase n=1 Tax=Micromonospora sp. RHAY321 TaxID=2944807 RepID=UPI00207D4BA1|nr:NUDIX domain-containing protein [Micromonospora sp. RHAY321]MCO1596919.1 NUDIX domain-containing protein [Micromonospora sp. RHAY321]